MFYLNRLFLLVAIVLAVNTATAQNIYEVEPNVDNCTPGKLNQETKSKIIKLINDIRARHKIAPIPWNEAVENRPQSAALSLAVLGWDPDPHGAKPGKKCTTIDSDSGRSQSNLSYASWNQTTEGHIIGWLIDNHNNPPENVGHRRLIINPFLNSTAYGDVYNNSTGGMAALWGITNEAMGPSTCENDFVAYPYENYPPAWVDKAFYLSFHPIANPNNWWSPGATNFTNAQIVVKDPNGNNMNVHSKAPDDGKAWGCFQHSLAFKVDGLQDSVRYDVTISNVIVNGQSRTYEYWFKLTNEPPIPPNPLAEVPTLVAPTNNTADVEAPVTFRWNTSENAVKYHLEGSFSNTFTYIAFEQDNITDTTFVYSAELTPNATYYWRVAAYNMDDAKTDYSPAWSFKTKEIIPEPPTNVFPLDGNEEVARRDNYQWHSVAGALHYNLQIASNQTFNALVIDQKEIYDTIYHLTETQMLDEWTNYYWRVKATLLSGSETDWSEVIQYKTDDRINGITEELAGVIINCYPNPFSEYVSITLDSDKENNVNVAIYNVLGEKIAELYDGVIQGIHTFNFKPTHSNADIYYCKIQIGSASKIIPLTFIKE